MKKKKMEVTTEIESEHKDLKEFAKRLNAISKLHNTAKNTLSEASHNLALLKAILKYEKKTTTRPEEIYIDNLKKRLEENINTLNMIYG